MSDGGLQYQKYRGLARTPNQLIGQNQSFRFINENLVLLIRSEKIGCAVTQSVGMMDHRRSAGGLGCWNNGFIGMGSFLMWVTRNRN